VKLENNWRNKSLRALAKQDWGESKEDSTYLVKRCILLSKIPVSEFTVEDLRMMIGQQFGLPYLIPLAIEKIASDLFVEGDTYAGDLLEKVLNIESSFWISSKDLWLEVNKLISGSKSEIAKEGLSLSKFNSVIF